MGGRERRTGELREGREAARCWKEGREGARIFAVAPERMVTRRRQPLNATATSGGDRRRTEAEPIRHRQRPIEQNAPTRWRGGRPLQSQGKQRRSGEACRHLYPLSLLTYPSHFDPPHGEEDHDGEGIPMIASTLLEELSSYCMHMQCIARSCEGRGCICALRLMMT